MLLEKVSIHTEIIFVHCYKLFLLLLVLFLCLLKIVYYCLWGINEFVVFLCIVHVWFWFFYPFTQIFIISHTGTIFFLIKRFRCYIFVPENKNALWNRILVLGKNCPCMTNNKNLSKRIKKSKPYKHKCIIAIIIFLLLAVFIFILNKPAFKWYKVPTMLLEKVSIHT
jgi:hypothetical protein